VERSDDLVFDGKAVAIPSGDKGSPVAAEGFVADDDVLDDLIEGGADVYVAIREGRAVVEKKEGTVGPCPLDLAVEVNFFPVVPSLRFPLGKCCPQREMGPR
jgi:hypothetical protein